MQTSIWEEESFYARQDIAIIGNGLNGLWAAWHLKQQSPSLKITIVDRGAIPTGASTRNAGFACIGSAGEMAHDLETMGPEKVWELADMRFRGIEQIRKTFSPASIGLEMNGGYELFGPDASGKTEKVLSLLPQLNTALASITGVNGLFSNRPELIGQFGFGNVRDLVFNPLEGQLHSGKLVQEMIKMVAGTGVQFLSSFETKAVEETGNDLTLVPVKGRPLQAGKVLLCTNGFTKRLLPELDVVPARGQVLVTAPIPQLRVKGCFHYDEGFYYFRNLGDRILLGGARNSDFSAEETMEMNTTAPIQQKLEAFLQEIILPGSQPVITHRWSGIMAMGQEKSPIVKALKKNLFCCVRMNGMGVALAPVVAKKAAELVGSA